MNEAETRAEHIDPALKAAGWGVVDGSRVRREVIAPGRLLGGRQRSQADIADYVLIYRNTKLAVIEAKAWARPKNMRPSWSCASLTAPTGRPFTAST
jgi:type I restriction enzyme R subunit